MVRKIIHVDMDCYYAAIEIRDNPSLRNKPIAVGGPADSRGVLCTSNYVARKYGVRSAMASSYAAKLCPGLIILPVNMDKYREVSAGIRDIFFHYTDLVEPLSLDEAYLDVSYCAQLQNSATLIAKDIRKKILKEFALTASAGIAPNKFLAKIASDLNKPNGQYVITPNQIDDFVPSLPVKKIFGVGKVTAKKLADMGIVTCADLQKKSRDELTMVSGKFGARLYDMARGIDERPVEPNRERKSISVEHTYAKDLQTVEECLEQIPDLLSNLQGRLAKKCDPAIDRVFVKVKFADFSATTVTKSCHELSIDFFAELVRTGFARQSKSVRLLGLGVGLNNDGGGWQFELDF